jgi:hypothetical protein
VWYKRGSTYTVSAGNSERVTFDIEDGWMEILGSASNAAFAANKMRAYLDFYQE